MVVLVVVAVVVAVAVVVVVVVVVGGSGVQGSHFKFSGGKIISADMQELSITPP